MRQAFEVLALTLALAGISTAAEPEPEPAGEIEVREIEAIWWGSSSTGMTKRALERATSDRLKMKYGKGGAWFRADWLSKSIGAGEEEKYKATMARIKDYAHRKKYELALFQMSGGILWSPESEANIEQVLDDMFEAIKAEGRTIIIFEHWTSRSPEKMRRYAIGAARKHGGKVAFCGSALAEVAEEKGGGKQGARYVGGLEGHTGPKGLYIASCVLYAAITGKSPVGLPPPKPKVGKKPKLPKDESAAVPGNPQKPKPGKHDDTFTAEELLYLQTKAWEVQQRYSKLLEEEAEAAGPPAGSALAPEARLR